MRAEKRSRSGQGAARSWLALAIAILWADQVRSDDLVASRGESSTPLHATSQIGARFDYSETRGHGTEREALVLKTYVTAAPSDRSFSTGSLIEYRMFDDDRRTLIAAGMFNYKKARWTAIASPFYEQTTHADGRWLYWGNVRRQLAPRHSLGLELYGSIETGEPSKWLLVYSGNLSKPPLSVSVAIGAGFDDGPDLVTRTTVMWRLGAARR